MESDNPTWTLDGLNLIPIVASAPASSSGVVAVSAADGGYAPRKQRLGFSCTGGQKAIVDNQWKLLYKGGAGQCTGQAPYFKGPLAKTKWKNVSVRTMLLLLLLLLLLSLLLSLLLLLLQLTVSFQTTYLLFNLDSDYHELHPLNEQEPAQFARMMKLMDGFMASIQNSQANETKCGKYNPYKPPPPAPRPPAKPSSKCTWKENTGVFCPCLCCCPVQLLIYLL